MMGGGEQACPAWCIADHTAEADGGPLRHRGQTIAVPGFAIRGEPPHDVHGVEVLIELHADEPEGLVAVYIGDGTEGIDLSTDTAARVVFRLIDTLRDAGTAPLSFQPTVAPNSRPRP
ncbi:MAG TPA: hypothetical protein VL294_05690 [Pseudolysinimonas sp.]|jgi:hypothetical protein|nr:hypothetical protein [Pseudolysinimonas sp.]